MNWLRGDENCCEYIRNVELSRPCPSVFIEKHWILIRRNDLGITSYEAPMLPLIFGVVENFHRPRLFNRECRVWKWKSVLRNVRAFGVSCWLDECLRCFLTLLISNTYRPTNMKKRWNVPMRWTFVLFLAKGSICFLWFWKGNWIASDACDNCDACASHQ